jgi:hypothetical protein
MYRSVRSSSGVGYATQALRRVMRCPSPPSTGNRQISFSCTFRVARAEYTYRPLGDHAMK